MKYYYLNADKKPAGPHTRDELQALKQTGLINDETLAAVAGDSKWKPLAELLSDCSTWNSYSEDTAVTPRVQKVELSLWRCFIRGFQKYAVFSGRASRKEFWGFYLFYAIISYAISKVSELCTLSQTMEFQQACEDMEAEEITSVINMVATYLSEPTVLIASIVSIVVSLILYVPFLSISVRRLHDTGSSALGVILGCASLSAVYGGMGYILVTGGENIEYPGLIFLFGVFALLVVSLYLFIKMLLPSEPRANKYGPESDI